MSRTIGCGHSDADGGDDDSDGDNGDVADDNSDRCGCLDDVNKQW